MADTFEVNVDVRLRIDDIIGGLDRDDVFKLIVQLDERIAEYEFTEKLRDHFAAILAKEDAA